MADCISICYKDERPAIIIIAGTLLVLLICAIFFFVVSGWDDLDPGTRIPVGLLLLAAIYGIKWVFGARRHKIEFNMNDGAKLIWISRSGDFKFKKTSTQNVVDFAQSAGLLRTTN